MIVLVLGYALSCINCDWFWEKSKFFFCKLGKKISITIFGFHLKIRIRENSYAIFYVFFATMMYVLHKTYTIKIHKIPTEQYPCSKNVGIRLRMHKLNACKYELPKTNFFYGAQFGRTNKRFFMIFLWLLLHQVNIIKIMQFSNR